VSLGAALRLAGVPQDEELAELGEALAKPAAVALGHSNHRRGHRDELVGLELDQRRCLGLTDSRRREKQRRRDTKHGGETGEDRGTRLLNATCLELSDRRARNAHTPSDFGLGEVQTLARGTDRERQRRT
jgi:hypothetical protein